MLSTYASAKISNLGNETVTLTDTTVSAADLLNLRAKTSGSVNVSALTSVTGTSSDQAQVAASNQFTGWASTSIICFLAGTLIATPVGQQPIETLQPGDLINTTEGPRPVRFISRQSNSPLLLAVNNELPICIAAGALGELGPSSDLYVSPGHGIPIDKHLVIARLLVNGTTITHTSLAHWEQKNCEQIVYLQIELEHHHLITAEGLLTESFGDGMPRTLWDNYADYINLYQQELRITELPLPHVVFKHQLPPSLSYLSESNQSPELALQR